MHAVFCRASAPRLFTQNVDIDLGYQQFLLNVGGA